MSINTKTWDRGQIVASVPGNTTPTQVGTINVGSLVVANFEFYISAIGGGGAAFYQRTSLCVKGGATPAFAANQASATNPLNLFGTNAMMGSDFVGGGPGPYSNMQFSFSGTNLVMTFTKVNPNGADVWVCYEAFLLT